MLLACAFYALTACFRPAVCVNSSPLVSFEISHSNPPGSNTIKGGSGEGEQRLTGSRLVIAADQKDTWSPFRDALSAQAALLPTAPSNEVISSVSVAARLLPESTPTAIPTPSRFLQAVELVDNGAAGSIATEAPSLRTQLRRFSLANATASSPLTTTMRATTTVYVNPHDCTETSTPTDAMARHSIPVSDAGQKGGIAGGTVGAVVLVAVLTLFCYRRVRRRTRNRRGLMSPSDSGSTTDDAERGMVSHAGLFGSDDKTASAPESFTADVPQISDPSVVTTTSAQVPICFRPSRRLVSRYPSLPVTPTASVRASDYLNPVVRETVLLPRALRLAGRTTLVRRQSWQAAPRRQPAPDESAEHPDGSTGWRNRAKSGSWTGTRSKSWGKGRSTSATNSSSSIYSSDATFDFAEYVTIGARTSRGSGTATQRASATTDASGLRSTLANFPRPPPYTFSRGDGRGLGTSWRESFVFSTPDDEVLLAFPELARQVEDESP
ncbi:hypothetical protein KVR01_000315 [Diaporthe batatas]|uniref:uncharacterized protein n=1 Tax=Diaporthe batatas TaxID=748121 RepID=UPI001D0513E6|nr:uncharacterized protein KVR01_000315 [Diaporthe batatas]KAG8169570.1 hypothetical protein KVR01_000315 [Diaporthe batatas]